MTLTTLTADTVDGFRYLNAPAPERCPACKGTGVIGGPDSFGNWDPCDYCENTGEADPRV
jgi:DnaJ-class molecular chaperone